MYIIGLYCIRHAAGEYKSFAAK